MGSFNTGALPVNVHQSNRIVRPNSVLLVCSNNIKNNDIDYDDDDDNNNDNNNNNNNK